MSREPIKTNQAGFSLLELLAAMGVFMLLAVMLFGVADNVSRLARRSTQNVGSFQQARDGFDIITRVLAQATLNTSYEYYDAAGRTLAELDEAGRKDFRPARYGRYSDLHLVAGPAAALLGSDVPAWSGEREPVRPGHAVFFQAPLGYSEKSAPGTGLDQLLNAAGFYVEYNSDKPLVPPFVAASGIYRERFRYRLMHFQEPSEALSVYRTSARDEFPGSCAWFRAPLGTTAFDCTRPIAENIVGLFLEARLADPGLPAAAQSLTGDYLYDSRELSNATTRHQLPPVIRVTMVAVDENSAVQGDPGPGAPPSRYLADPAWFTKTERYAEDLAALANHLNGLVPKVSYRVMTTDVSIAGAKWSAEDR